MLATAVWAGLAVQELALLDLSYAPPFSGVYDPLLIAARAVVEAALTKSARPRSSTSRG